MKIQVFQTQHTMLFNQTEKIIKSLGASVIRVKCT